MPSFGCVLVLTAETTNDRNILGSRRRIGKISWKYLVGGVLIVIAFVSGLWLGLGLSTNTSSSALLGCGDRPSGYPFCPHHFVEVTGEANVTQGNITSIWFYSIPSLGIGQYPMIALPMCGEGVFNTPSHCEYDLNLWADKVLQSDVTINGQLHHKGEIYSTSYNVTIVYVANRSSALLHCSATPYFFRPTLPPSQNAVIQNFAC